MLRMLAQRRQRLLAVFLVVLGCAGWWFARQGAVPEAPEQKADAGRPDYVVDGIRAMVMDDSGHPARQFSADQLRHFPRDDSSELDQPRLQLFDRRTPPWRIRADQGWFTADADHVILSGEVQARRAADAETPELGLSTTRIEVFPDQSFVQTDQFVNLEHGADWITAAHGLEFWYSEPMRAKLFGRVHSRIAPDTAPVQVNAERAQLPDGSAR